METALIIGGVVVVLVLVLIWVVLIGPRWNVWAQRKQGEADLEQAHMEQQIQIASAKSALEAAKLNKQATIIDAEAQAEAIRIIGKGLHNNPGYLQYQWIKMMDDRDGGADVVYVPTEAGLPVLEAGKGPGAKRRGRR
jgi:regulator of protease activity HflC (stomatin/prohibitin superfamily)